MTLRTMLLFALLAPVVVGGCDAYDPPPETKVVIPSDGVWTKNTPLTLQFSEAIDADTLVVTIWPQLIDDERNIRPDVVPIVEICTVATAPCGTLEMVMNEEGDAVTLTPNDTFDDQEGVPLIVQVHAGLKDLNGRERKVDDFLEGYQVSPLCGRAPIDLPLQTGVISLTFNLQVFPIFINLYLDIAIDADTGDTLVVATYVKRQEGQPNDYNHPDGLELHHNDSAFAVPFEACVLDRGDGTFFLQSDPFDIHMLAGGTIPVFLEGFKVQGTIVPGGAPDGRDFASGTLATTGGSFGDPPNALEAITSPWDGFAVKAEEIEPEMPRVCGDDPCAAMDSEGGDCQLGDAWAPSAALCPAE